MFSLCIRFYVYWELILKDTLDIYLEIRKEKKQDKSMHKAWLEKER